MKQREKILLIAACGVVGIWIALPLVQRIFLAPIHERQSTLATLGEEFITKTREIVQVKKAGESLRRWREQSLPPEPLDAQRLYQAWLTDLAQLSGFSDLRVAPERRIEKPSVYTSSLVSLDGKATLQQLGDFLRRFYRTDLLHRVVSFNITSPSYTGDPRLEFSLLMEGVSLRGAQPREHLFAQTAVKDSFRSTAQQQTMEVVNATLFPNSRPFAIRIGEETLNVSKTAGAKWTVVGGREGSRPTTHDQGEIVELAPVRTDSRHDSDAMLQQLVENSPFVKPAPKIVVSTPRTPRPRQSIDRSAEETFLAASISKDGEPQAWLYRNGTRSKVLRRSSKLVVGDVEATVEDIQPEYVILHSNEKLWRLRMGRNLTSLEEIPLGESPPSDASPDNIQ